jgi:hypothetical protein
LKTPTTQANIPPSTKRDIPRAPKKDESINGAAASPDPMIKLAKRDLDAGLVDTDMRATPGLDAKRRARLVPNAGGKPPKAME